uniref:Uncharacterized protein n=1 Tax=Anguilla anguilla TaxID=7936 RepID=A0A0E9T486_ANGAN
MVCKSEASLRHRIDSAPEDSVERLMIEKA